MNHSTETPVFETVNRNSVKDIFKSIVGTVQNILTSKILWFLIGGFLLLSLIVGGIIYWGIFSYLLVFGIASIWIPQLRGFLSKALVVGALIFLANGLLLQPINGVLSEKFPSYESYVGSNIANMDLWFAEGTIMHDKKAMFSEAVIGTLGKMTKSSVVYTADGEFQSPRITRGKDTEIKLLGVLREGAGKGLAKVMFLNAEGDFFNGPEGYIPVKKIELDNPTKASTKTEKKDAGGGFWFFGDKLSSSVTEKKVAEELAIENARMKANGWQKLTTSAPDTDGFVTPITPRSAIGKRYVLFKNSELVSVRVGSNPPIPYEAKMLEFLDQPIKKLPDLKFKNPSKEKRWVKFQ